MSTSPNIGTLAGSRPTGTLAEAEGSSVRSSDDFIQGIKPTNSDALDILLSPPQLILCNGNEVATSSSDQSPSDLNTVKSLHSTSSEPVFNTTCEAPPVRTRPRAKSVPTMAEQQVALFLRTVSDDINDSYGGNNGSPNAADRNRRSSYPGNIRLQEALSPLLRALPSGIRSPTNSQQGSTSGSEGGTAVTSRRFRVGGHFSNSSMDSVPEEETDSGDEV